MNTATLIGSVNDDGYIPAILEEGSKQAIIPAIEGLIFPWIAGLIQEVDIEGRNGNLIKVLGASELFMGSPNMLCLGSHNL